jgi:thiosulfate/3-mercaptopyruvate sulfurtransferase
MITDMLPTPLVSVAWLAEHLDDPNVRIVDSTLHLPTAGRDAAKEYEAGHIPGAVFADIGWLSDESAPFPHTLLGPEAFAQRMGALGISNETNVVVYDTSGQNYSAPRFWWMMKTFGHDRVAVLDGGLPKWTSEGHAVTRAVPTITPAKFVADFDAARVRDIGDMRRNIDAQAEQVADARSPGRFRGTEPEPRAGVRGGHMPGSVNVHYATLVNEDGTLRSRDELRAIIGEKGLDLSRPIVVSCGTGVTACAVILALDVLGKKDTAVFDGSWTEWGSAADTPIERDDAKTS